METETKSEAKQRNCASYVFIIGVVSEETHLFTLQILKLILKELAKNSVRFNGTDVIRLNNGATSKNKSTKFRCSDELNTKGTAWCPSTWSDKTTRQTGRDH